MTLQSFREWYESEYKHPPSGKLVESFILLHPQQEPEPTLESFWQDEEPRLPKFKITKV